MMCPPSTCSSSSDSPQPRARKFTARMRCPRMMARRVDPDGLSFYYSHSQAAVSSRGVPEPGDRPDWWLPKCDCCRPPRRPQTRADILDEERPARERIIAGWVRGLQLHLHGIKIACGLPVTAEERISAHLASDRRFHPMVFARRRTGKLEIASNSKEVVEAWLDSTLQCRRHPKKKWDRSTPRYTMQLGIRTWWKERWGVEKEERAGWEEIHKWHAHIVYHEWKVLLAPDDGTGAPKLITRSLKHALMPRKDEMAWMYAWEKYPLKDDDSYTRRDGYGERWMKKPWSALLAEDYWNITDIVGRKGHVPGELYQKQAKKYERWIREVVAVPWSQDRHTHMSCPVQYPEACEYRKRGLEHNWWALVEMIGLPEELANSVCECFMLGFHASCDSGHHHCESIRMHRSSEGELDDEKAMESMSSGISEVSKMSSEHGRSSTAYSYSSSAY